MYEAYYGFEEKPFALSPDPKYLFLSATHREVLGHLLYGIEQGEGFMAISGEVGTGKTTLCRTLLDRLGASCEIAFLFNPMLTPTELIRAINAEFGLSTFGDSRPELLDVLNTFLLERNAEGRRVLVIIDEAQNLPMDTLEQLRLLSNLESRTAKLLQIVLIGQPELDEKLEAKELRQLRQRITVWWRLGPLAASETREYVRHRVRVASGTDRPLFSDAALALVHRLSGGVPRLVNVLCDRALLAGYGERIARIEPRQVRTVAEEVRLAPPSRRLWPWGLGLAAVTAAAALALAPRSEVPGLAAVLGGLGLGAPRAAAPPPAVAAAAPAAPAAAVSQPEPTPEAAAPRAAPSEPDALPEPVAVPAADLPAERAADRVGEARLSDDVLDSLLTLGPPDATNALTLAAVLDAWGEPGEVPEALDFPAVLAALESRGLRVLRIGAPDEIGRLDVPTLVRVRGPDAELRALLVRHVQGDDAQLEGVLEGELVTVSLSSLAERWDGDGYAVWRDFEGLPPLLRDGGSGPAVAFLQRSLAELGHYADEPHGSYDDATRRAVMSFQRAAGLAVDGQCGPRTQIRLYHALPAYRMPAVALAAGTNTARRR